MIAQSQGLANDDSQAKSNPLPAYLWPVSKDWFLCLKTVGKKSKEKWGEGSGALAIVFRTDCGFFYKINFSHTQIHILFHIFHYGLLQDIENSSVCYIVGPSCLSILIYNTLHLLISNSQAIPPCPPPLAQVYSLCV